MGNRIVLVVSQGDAERRIDLGEYPGAYQRKLTIGNASQCDVPLDFDRPVSIRLLGVSNHRYIEWVAGDEPAVFTERGESVSGQRMARVDRSPFVIPPWTLRIEE